MTEKKTQHFATDGHCVLCRNADAPHPAPINTGEDKGGSDIIIDAKICTHCRDVVHQTSPEGLKVQIGEDEEWGTWSFLDTETGERCP